MTRTHNYSRMLFRHHRQLIYPSQSMFDLSGRSQNQCPVRDCTIISGVGCTKRPSMSRSVGRIPRTLWCLAPRGECGHVKHQRTKNLFHNMNIIQGDIWNQNLYCTIFSWSLLFLLRPNTLLRRLVPFGLPLSIRFPIRMKFIKYLKGIC